MSHFICLLDTAILFVKSLNYTVAAYKVNAESL